MYCFCRHCYDNDIVVFAGSHSWFWIDSVAVVFTLHVALLWLVPCDVAIWFSLLNKRVHSLYICVSGYAAVVFTLCVMLLSNICYKRISAFLFQWAIVLACSLCKRLCRWCLYGCYVSLSFIERAYTRCLRERLSRYCLYVPDIYPFTTRIRKYFCTCARAVAHRN